MPCWRRRAVCIVLEFKVGSRDFAMRRTAGRSRIMRSILQDFHSGSRGWPIVPVLVATDAQAAASASGGTWPMMLAGVVGSVLDCSGVGLGELLRSLVATAAGGRDAARGRSLGEPRPIGRYPESSMRPAPSIRITVSPTSPSARADAINLSTTTQAILDTHRRRRRPRTSHHAVLFVTGIPGAGKTLCGLNAVFGAGRDRGSAFLTGNPTLDPCAARGAGAGRGRPTVAMQTRRGAATHEGVDPVAAEFS